MKAAFTATRLLVFPNPMLTDFIATLAAKKVDQLNRALTVALDLV